MTDKQPELYGSETGFIHRAHDTDGLEALGNAGWCRIYNNGYLLEDRYEIEEKYENAIAAFYISNPFGDRSFIDSCVPKIEADVMAAALNRVPDLTDDERIVVSEISLHISNYLYAKFEGVGSFGIFIESVIAALNVEKFSKQKLSEEIEWLRSILQHWYKNETNLRELNSMPTEFFIGYITGLLSPALDLKPEWWALKNVYERVGGQITTNQQTRRGSQKGAIWTDGMEEWLSKKIAGIPTKETKSGLALIPSNRAFAISIRAEAIDHNRREFGYNWSNEQAAFEWIQKAIRKILNP